MPDEWQIRQMLAALLLSAADFPEPTTFNGPDMRPMGSSRGTPTRYRCLNCPWTGYGIRVAGEHHRETGHRVLWHGDPRPGNSVPVTE